MEGYIALFLCFGRPLALAHWPDSPTLGARSCVARQEPYIPGALSILQGTVPGRVRGSGHMVPTYFRRCSGIECFNGLCGFALFLLSITLFRLIVSFGRYSLRRHTPRKRSIQYAAATRFQHERLWNTGSPAPVRNCAQGG
jgi:hypothetical protein